MHTTGRYHNTDDTWDRIYDHPYNFTASNERGVELAEARVTIGSWEADAKILEVGNVLAHYPELDRLAGPRRIVDLFEQGEGVENIDVLDITGSFDGIIAISTLEHVGVDDGTGDPDRALAAITHLRRLLRLDGELFVTFPFGWNEALDAAWTDGQLGPAWDATWQRDGNGGWDEMTTTTPPGYGVTQPWAEAVWVGTFGPLVTRPS